MVEISHLSTDWNLFPNKLLEAVDYNDKIDNAQKQTMFGLGFYVLISRDTV